MPFLTTYSSATIRGFTATSRIYSTWDPVGANATRLSADKLTQESYSGYTTNGGGNGATGTIAKTSGKWYYEFKSNSTIPGSQALGAGLVGNYTSTISVFEPNSNAYLWYFNSSSIGSTYANGTFVDRSTAYILGPADIGGVAYDLDGLTATFFKNGVQAFVLNLPSGLTWYPITANGSSAPVSYGITANFGQTPFSYPVPSGYNSGVYQ